MMTKEGCRQCAQMNVLTCYNLEYPMPMNSKKTRYKSFDNDELLHPNLKTKEKLLNEHKLMGLKTL
jgi:hypothetical protein